MFLIQEVASRYQIFSVSNQANDMSSEDRVAYYMIDIIYLMSILIYAEVNTFSTEL